MKKKEILDAWSVDQLDPDNFLSIPDFGVSPHDVEFVGFTYPIVNPDSGKLRPRHENIRELVGLVRQLIQREFTSLDDIRVAHIQVLDVIFPEDGSNAIQKEIDQLPYRNLCASYFTFAMQALESAARDFIGADIEKRFDNAAIRLGEVALWIGYWATGNVQTMKRNLLQISLKNSSNAANPRPNARKIDRDELLIEFQRLVAEGHTDREARGILVQRGNWGSQSQIYRITKSIR